MNTSNSEISLDGWIIADKQKNKMPLNGTIGPGTTRTINITEPVTLSNQGGIITLLDDRGLRINDILLKIFVIDDDFIIRFATLIA